MSGLWNETEIMKRKDFLNRLLKLSECRDELLQYLLEDKVITEDDVRNMKMYAGHIGRYMEQLLRECERDEKLQMINYDWVVLPTERLRLTIVTFKTTREFSYNWF